MREPKLNEKVKLNNCEKIYKIESIFLTEITLVECRRGRGEKEKCVVELSELIFLEEEKVKKVKPPKDNNLNKIKLTKEQRGQILKNLVTEESINQNFKREIIGVAKLVNKFPHVEFLLEGFKPAIKANSVFYWINRPEVEQLYKNWAVDLSKPIEVISLEREKVVEDLPVERKKPKNLLDLLA